MAGCEFLATEGTQVQAKTLLCENAKEGVHSSEETKRDWNQR